MRTRATWLFLVTAALLGSLVLFDLADLAPNAWTAHAETRQSPQQILVEDVLIEGNRRLRDEDIIYHIQTRKGDPFNEEQIGRDLQALLNLPFFDKTETRVATENGPLGGKIVIFYVKELPVIRDLTFKGLGSLSEADVLKAFREQRVGVSKESTFDPVKVNAGKRVIKELLAQKGYPNATVEAQIEEISLTSVAVTFNVDSGERVRVVEIEFEGNEVFSDGELRKAMKLVKEAGFISRFKGQDILHNEKLEYDLKFNVVNYMRSKGYLEARTLEPRVEGLGPKRTGFPVLPLPLLTSVDEALRVIVPVVEGKLYRLGDIKIEGNSIYSEQDIRAVIGLQPGDVANGFRLNKALNEDIKKLYGRSGFIQYFAEFEPNFKENPQNPKEGIADFTITITEGKQFSLRRLEFLGNTYTRDNVLRREVALNEGDIFDETLWEFSVLRLNQLGFFDPIDKEKDAEFRTDEEVGTVDINLRVAERGRNQINFQGGISGVSGSYFGLEYSTSNLLGRGESLSFQFAFGNRQRSFQFSFTEPYVRDRPISVGFSIYAQSIKFFGEGTFLSANINALTGAFGTPQDFLTVSDENLFTQKTAGGSLFASSPLSEFYRPKSRRMIELVRATRIGLSYSLSRSSIEDPPINERGDPNSFIPVIFAQPNIITSRITPTLAYDTRNAAIDPTTGRKVTLQLGFAGLGGDVRTYQPVAEYTQFIPVRRKRSENPEVFGFRLMAGHVGSFGITPTVEAAQASSLSFINGVPIYERFFIGDEFTIRGYEVRSIGPIVPLEVYITSRGVSTSAVSSGDIVPLPGISDRLNSQLVGLGSFTGPSGNNSLQIQQTFRLIGGDTQLLGNFEYRVPILNDPLPFSIAAFADIGTAFNLRSYNDQVFSTEFLPDLPFISNLGGLAQLVAAKNQQLALGPATDLSGLRPLVIRGDRLVTKEELTNALGGPFDPLTGLPIGMQGVYLRAAPSAATPDGGVQTNTVARLSQARLAKIGDYRTSLGVEFRIQIPIANLPFRFIYFFNPNARTEFINEKKSGYKFSIGRTF
jgi:outer membrane protein insertion porin family